MVLHFVLPQFNRLDISPRRSSSRGNGISTIVSTGGGSSDSSAVVVLAVVVVIAIALVTVAVAIDSVETVEIYQEQWH